jgi:hypothetical protein
VSALLLACLFASPSLAASSPVTFRGTTASGGTVEFDLSADGATVTRFQAAGVPMTCGIAFDATAEGAYPVFGGSFSNGSPMTGLVFGGTFHGAQLGSGTVSYRIVNVRYDSCSSETVSWTAAAPSPVPQPPPAGIPPRGGTGEGRPTPSSSSSVLVAYRQEGGIGGPRPSLVVSVNRRARVSLGRCTAKFELGPKGWSGLRAALRNAHIQAIAGDYPLPTGSADLISYVVTTRSGTVRIAPGSQPANEEVMRKLRPLLKVLDQTVSAGKRRMAPSCGAARGAADARLSAAP